MDRRNDRGQNPPGGVALKGCAEIVTLLLDHGADMHADNGGSATPLAIAKMFWSAGNRGAFAGARRVVAEILVE